MDLQLIRNLSEKRAGGMRKLAADIGMSEANLHRCVSNNKIQASDLEKIASLLGVDISTFFTGEVVKSPVTQRGTQNNVNGDNNIGQSADTATLLAQIEEKDKQIARLLDIIEKMGK